MSDDFARTLPRCSACKDKLAEDGISVLKSTHSVPQQDVKKDSSGPLFLIHYRGDEEDV